MKYQQGYIAIVSVLIISVVVLAIALTVSLLSIGEGQASFALFKGEDTLTFVEGCAEDALLKARNSNTYTGGTITQPEGTCSISVSKSGNNWTIDATTTDTKYKRSVEVKITRSTSLQILSWKEI